MTKKLHYACMSCLFVLFGLLSYDSAKAVTGGPDSYGYVYRASTDPNGPIYSWIELAAGAPGTLSGTSVKSSLSSLDDGYFYGIPVGFSFPFYGTNHDTLTVSSNGTIYFQAANLSFSNICPMPGTSGYTPQSFIAHFWDDLILDDADYPETDILYKNFSGYTVIEYYHVSSYGDQTSYNTWEVILQNNGNIILQYQDVANVDARGSYTVGIQNSPTVGLLYSACNTSGTVSAGLAVEFYSPCLIPVNLGPDTTACNSITLNAGNPGATYVWSNGASTQTVTLTSATNISVTVTDTNGCIGQDAVAVRLNTSPPATGYSLCQGATVPGGAGLTAAACGTVPTIVTSFSGSLDATDPVFNRSVSGTTYTASGSGTAVYYDTYTFSVSATGTYIFDMCGAGNYDAHASFYTSSFNPASPATNFVQADDDGGTGCSVGPHSSITLTAGVTYIYVATSFSNGTTGAYTVTFSGPGTVSTGGVAGTLLWYTAASGGSSISSASPFDPTTTANSGITNTNTPGTYTFYAACSGAPSCRTAVDFVVKPNPIVALGADANVCTASKVLDAGNAGSTYAWSAGGATSQTYSATATGNYSVTVTTAGCSAADTIHLNFVTPPTVNLGRDTAQCGGTVTLNAGNAGSTYAWSNSTSAQTAVISGTGAISVTVTDANTCTATDTVNVTIHTLPVVNLGRDTAQCGGTVTLDAGNAGSTYAWSNSTSAQTAVISGTATVAVTVTDANTCKASDTVNVTIHTLPVVNLGRDTVRCGGSVTLNAGNPGSTYAWSNSTSAQTAVISGTAAVSVTVTDANLCKASDTISVTIHTLPVVSLGHDSTRCGGAFTLDAGNAGSSYTWSTGVHTQTISASSTAAYSVTVTDANTCTAADTVNLSIYTLPAVHLGADVVRCGGSVTLDAGNAGSSYAWSTSAVSQTITASSTAAYAVTVTDNHLCRASDTVNVTIHTIPTVTLALVPDSVCLSSTAVTLSGGTPAGGSFFGTHVSTGHFTPSTAGNNTIYYGYVDGNGCGDTASASLYVKVCSGINELSSGSVDMYPNPATDAITLRADGISGAIEVSMIDVLGQEVAHFTDVVSSATYTHAFDVRGYAKGSYLANIKTTSGNVNFKFIVQ